MKQIVLAALLIAGLYAWLSDTTLAPTRPAPSASPALHASPAAFSRADSNRQVQGEGVVIKVLADDNEGSRHQKFLLRLASGQTVLVAHNIDLAPRVAPLSAGDTVAFNGEYEWNEKGGVVHWTHLDPQRRHADGWLKSGGRTYQ